MFRASVRTMSTAARQSLRIGLIPADGIGKEVIPVCTATFSSIPPSSNKLIFAQAAKAAILALGSDIPKPQFVDLSAGWETFTRTGVALPQETVEYVYLLRHLSPPYSLS